MSSWYNHEPVEPFGRAPDPFSVPEGEIEWWLSPGRASDDNFLYGCFTMIIANRLGRDGGSWEWRVYGERVNRRSSATLYGPAEGAWYHWTGSNQTEHCRQRGFTRISREEALTRTSGAEMKHLRVRDGL